jgi:hypothetical protein
VELFRVFYAHSLRYLHLERIKDWLWWYTATEAHIDRCGAKRLCHWRGKVMTSAPKQTVHNVSCIGMTQRTFDVLRSQH